MASNTCRCCMHIIEIAWVKLYHEWNFLEHSWFSKLDFEVKSWGQGSFQGVHNGNGEIFEDGGPDGRLGNDFQDEVPSFPSSLFLLSVWVFSVCWNWSCESFMNCWNCCCCIIIRSCISCCCFICCMKRRLNFCWFQISLAEILKPIITKLVI